VIERALEKVYGPASPNRSATLGRSARVDALLVLLALAAAVVLPVFYAMMLPGGALGVLQGANWRHLFLNGGANALVALLSIRLNDRYDRKLAAILTRMLVVHGSLAFFILTARQPYSNQVMLVAAVSSAGLGVLVMSIKHKVTQLRAALIGPWHPLVDKIQISCNWIEDPAADLAAYDLLLVENVADLSSDWTTALSRAMLVGTPVRLLAEFVEEHRGQVSVDHFDLDHLPAAGLTSYRTRKRLMDLGLVVLAAPVALLLLVFGALLVLVTMGRPVLFVQSRVGLGGVPFSMYKLRTMTAPPTAGEARATESPNDARITPAGRWLRRFRIDELPQLWNVLVGQMSVIGPRPEWTLLSEQYVQSLPVYAYRHLVRPGITGWAQVKGGYAADLAETRAKVGYDLFYIKNLSFSLDVQILGRTIWTLLSGSGAR
jgi:lipopolysaccharide/colanic/teichoic acid biosynthesis glycosyltransferase